MLPSGSLEKSRRDICAQPSKPKGSGDRAKRKVADGPVASYLWQKYGECPDRERTAKNEDAKKDNGSRHGGGQSAPAYETAFVS
jgi:hypothetical protein